VTVIRAGASSKGSSRQGSNGTVFTVQAQLGSDGRWHAPAGLRPPDAAIIMPGAIVDSYGETNTACFGDAVLSASFTSSAGPV
ncbi:MAG TPA: hypothetical protein VG408_08825, partial [Actinomycetota bacterium]|nr:hypothetical protein [Actinomycetota bacterium]